MSFKQLYSAIGLVAGTLFLGGCFAQVDSDYYVVGDPELGVVVFHNASEIPVYIIVDACDHDFHVATKVRHEDEHEDGEVEICHVPPGNPDNEHTIWVGESAVQKHINKHGDWRGACDDAHVDHRDDDLDTWGDDGRHTCGWDGSHLNRGNWHFYPAFDPEYPACEGDFSVIRVEAEGTYEATFDPGSFDPGLYTLIFAVSTDCEEAVITPFPEVLPTCKGIIPVRSDVFEVAEVGIDSL